MFCESLAETASKPPPWRQELRMKIMEMTFQYRGE